jgi:pyridoxine/pyridoxamine 5'-phosphate oxidase
MLVRASRDRKSAWRTPVLATVGLDGAPRARVLVLRRVEPEAGVLWLHTDRRAAKWAELSADPRVALTFWDPRRVLQLRMEGRARLEEDAAVLVEAWARVPEGSRRNYATADAPGSPRLGDVAHVPDGRPNFAMVAIRAERLDWLWLGPVAHQRGESRRVETGWESRALIP